MNSEFYRALKPIRGDTFLRDKTLLYSTCPLCGDPLIGKEIDKIQSSRLTEDDRIKSFMTSTDFNSSHRTLMTCLNCNKYFVSMFTDKGSALVGVTFEEITIRKTTPPKPEQEAPLKSMITCEVCKKFFFPVFIRSKESEKLGVCNQACAIKAKKFKKRYGLKHYKDDEDNIPIVKLTEKEKIEDVKKQMRKELVRFWNRGIQN